MINRRGFLGSLIGTIPLLATPSKILIDFFARTDKEEWQRIILPYRMLFKDGISGEVIQAPGVKEIKETDSGLSFVAERLNVVQPLQADRAILLTEQGIVISEVKFAHPIVCINGDSLSVTTNLNFPDFNYLKAIKLDHQQLVDLFTRCKHGEDVQIGNKVYHGTAG